MPIRQEEHILIHPIHRKGLRIMLHNMEVKRHQVISTSKRPSRVTTLYTMHHPYYIPPHLSGYILKLRDFHCAAKIGHCHHLLYLNTECIPTVSVAFSLRPLRETKLLY